MFVSVKLEERHFIILAPSLFHLWSVALRMERKTNISVESNDVTRLIENQNSTSALLYLNSFNTAKVKKVSYNENE